MEDRSQQIVALNALFMAMCALIVGLRIFCRSWITRSFGLDDWLMVVAWLLFQMYLTTQLMGVHYGTGKHHVNLEPERQTKALLWWFLCELFYITSTTVLKFSVGVFLLRIAVDMKHVWILRILLGATAVFGTTYFFLVVFQCKPVAAFWEVHPNAPGYCLPASYILIFTYTASCLNCVADWIFGLLPAFIVWGLAMSFKNKVLVGILLSFAAIGSTATIFRATVLGSLTNADDFLYATTDVAIWSTVEPGIGIAAASLATLRPFFQLVAWKLGISGKGPSNPGWNERNRSRSGYIEQSGTSSSIAMRAFRPPVNDEYHSSFASAENSESTRNYTIEAKPRDKKSEDNNARLGASVLETKEVIVTNSDAEKSDEFHVQKWGAPWQKDGWS